MKPATEILLSAAFALTLPEHWTKRTLARDARGRAVDDDSEKACRWCLVGAIHQASLVLGDDRIARGDAYAALGRFGQWNDTHTHAEVLAALYKAAALSEADRDS